MMHPVSLVMLIASLMTATDQTPNDLGGPVSTVRFMEPLKIEEAAKWYVSTQVKVIPEKDGLVFVDTAQANYQTMIVYSISYFKGFNGQMFAIVTYLRPRAEGK